jgi:hypothetical protein
MKRLMAAIIGAVFALFVLSVSTINSVAADDAGVPVLTVTQFDSMFTVKGAFLGAMNPIRGVPGAGLPWSLGSVKADLKTNGALLIDVRGLVLADDPMVPENLRLTNPVANFMGIVSCKSMDGMGNVVKVNTSTGLYPAPWPVTQRSRPCSIFLIRAWRLSSS